VALADAFRELTEPVANGKRRPHGALRIVLVRLRGAENGEHGVPGELLGRAPVPLDLGVDQLEELTEKCAEVLGVDPLAERGRAREVGEEHGNDAPFLPLVGSASGATSILVQGGTAGRTEGSRRRLLGPAAGASLVKRHATATAVAGVGRVLGFAGSARQCHAPSVRRGNPGIRMAPGIAVGPEVDAIIEATGRSLWAAPKGTQSSGLEQRTPTA
jgi:hypothetical protein